MKHALRAPIIGLMFASTVLVLAFQNCSGEVPGKGGESSFASTSTDIVFDSIPADATFFLGTQGSIAVNASSLSGLPLTYQWYRNGAELSGQIYPTLEIPSVAVTDQGQYRLVVRNSTGTNSVSVNVSVSADPGFSITTQPQPLNLTIGTNGTIAATISNPGSQVLTYQWFKDGESVLGGTAASIIITSARAIHAGMWEVEITNPTGIKIRSNAVRVTVQGAINVNSATGCGNGFCSCVVSGQPGVQDPAAALAICVFRGYPNLISFATTAGVRGRVHCDAQGLGCFTNQNTTNLTCTTVTCSK